MASNTCSDGTNLKGKYSLSEDIIEHLANKNHVELVRHILEKILKETPSREIAEKQAYAWLQWAKHREHVKVVTCDIPDNILSQRQRGLLHDARVFSKKRMPDDAIYDNNLDLRQKLARGNCFMEILTGPDAGLTCLVYAMKKFTGGLGDDDDRESGDNQTWKKYFSKPIEETKLIVATRKANGEAAHFSARKISGEIYISAGSKNVHLLVKSRKDVEKYEADRFNYAKEICHVLLDLLENMEAKYRKRLLRFLCDTKLTAVMEMESPTHQHVEDFSHLKRTELKFITWTSSDLDQQPDNLCCMSPHVAIDIAQSLGLSTVPYEIIEMDRLEDKMKEIRQGYAYEGEVLYFMDSEDTVIGLLKKKTIWYILCRATREKLRAAFTSYQKSPDNFSVSVSLTKLEKRFDQIQQWLSLDQETIDEWKALSCKCMRWCLSHLQSGKLHTEDIADKFPVTWRKFLDDTMQTDHIKPRSYDDACGSDILCSV